MSIQHYICVACGAQYGGSADPPQHCRICADQRQPQPVQGQRWTTMRELAGSRRNRISEIENGAFSIRTEPAFAIGQRSYLIRTAAGNVLWDCVHTIDRQTVERVNAVGGIQTVALSHPHFYGSAVDWSQAFGGVPVYVHNEDRDWILRPDPCFVHWTGTHLELLPGISLVHCGGHFPGSAVLHWRAGAEGRGVLFASDTLYVCPDGRWLSFMYSYPNYIPLGEVAVACIRDRVRTVSFDRIYGAFEAGIRSGGAQAVDDSAARYIAFLRSGGLSAAQ